MFILRKLACSSSKKSSVNDEKSSQQAIAQTLPLFNPDLAFKKKSLKVVGVLDESKFPVLLMQQITKSSPASKKMFYAIKAYPSPDNTPLTNYLRETQFVSLNHPNIVKFHNCIDKMPFQLFPEQNTSCMSAIAMEFCELGDLTSCMDQTPFVFEDFKLVRTLFR